MTTTLVIYISFFSILAGALSLALVFWVYRQRVAKRLVLIIVGEDNRIYTRLADPSENVVTALSPKGEKMTYNYDRSVVLYKKHFFLLGQWTPTLMCVEGIPTPIDPRAKTANTVKFGKQLAGLLDSDIGSRYAQGTKKKEPLMMWIVGSAAAVMATVVGLGYYLVTQTSITPTTGG